jgi:hypothetical protein
MKTQHSAFASNNNSINVNLSSWTIYYNEMYELLTTWNIHSGNRLDGIPSVFLKSRRLLKPLYIMINKSLSLDYFPDIWKNHFLY